ncbi:MAG: class I SAM-dependent methyltransferase [Planctomycetes bacterium]|nr:class I SAM-dependent methyltransferase [Planctomycetota bacterium]
MTDLLPLLERALERRAALETRLAAEDTTALRWFHGVAEGRPGLTLDRYGTLFLAQTFRAPLAPDEVELLAAFVRERGVASAGPGARFAWNHRGETAHTGVPDETDEVFREGGVSFVTRARHRGLDPWLFLDLRAARRRLRRVAAGKSVLNLFAYTCGAGIAAAAAGAREVWNVDFAASSLEVGRRNAELNRLDPERVRFVQEDCLPVMTQLAGLLVKGRASVRKHTRFEARRFDVVFLDPPAWSKSAFGAVDVVRDYPSLFKPALLATEPGGLVVATNHVASVAAADWTTVLARAAEKAGRPLASIEVEGPDDDVPAFDGAAPLKVAWCRLA